MNFLCAILLNFKNMIQEKNMRSLILMILIFVSLLSATNEDSTGTIIIEMTNFKNDNGKVRVSLFRSDDGFPEDYNKAVTYINQTIVDGKSRVVFEKIPYGEYAIGFLHDENLDSKLNTNWLGMPKEGIAASNNAKGRFGPPDFEDARFTLNKDTLLQVIKIEYL